METARSRIIQFIDNQKINTKDFLKKTGVKKGFIDKSHQNSGATDIYLSKILEGYPEINPTWLLTGKGSMLLNNKKENIAGEPATVYKASPLVQEKEPPQVSSLQYEIESLKERIKDKEEIVSLYKERLKEKEEIINSHKDRLKEREEIIISQKEKLKEGEEKTAHLEEKTAKDGVFIQCLKKQLAELQEKWAELNKKLLVEKKDYRSLMDAGGSVPAQSPANKPSVVPVEGNKKKQRPYK